VWVLSFRSVSTNILATKLSNEHSVGIQWENVAKAYSNIHSAAALAADSHAAAIQIDNKFAMAAKIWKEMGVINEKEHNTAEAIKTDEKAANWSANKRSRERQQRQFESDRASYARMSCCCPHMYILSATSPTTARRMRMHCESKWPICSPMRRITSVPSACTKQSARPVSSGAKVGSQGLFLQGHMQ
jgi:hypothetical protein